ncbi:MAG TPA: hypothetical protein VG267_12980 [Terracidiphilus sp.]|jgi:amino acid transporter|nr:hypothetical protein [Terracidiphilus sp.]
MPPLPQPDRKIGPWTATAVVIGESISLGIFLTPASMAKSLGSPALVRHGRHDTRRRHHLL